LSLSATDGRERKMADKHPYIPGTGNLVKAVQQLRSSLPTKIDAGVFKKLGIAPNNESYLINILRYLNAIDQEGVPSTEARSAFTQHDDAAFGHSFSGIVKKAYSDIFSLHGDKAWTLDVNALVTFFRQSDQTSSVVGGLQAATFHTLAALAGHGEPPEVRAPTTRKGRTAEASHKTSRQEGRTATQKGGRLNNSDNKLRDVGLAVRIEINLPVSEDQATYDRIFKSIRENLLNG
jgi:uncharacterized protein DUF5343